LIQNANAYGNVSMRNCKARNCSYRNKRAVLTTCEAWNENSKVNICVKTTTETGVVHSENENVTAINMHLKIHGYPI